VENNMGQIGPNFGNEFIAAGLGGTPVAWTSEGEFFNREQLTEEQNATLDGVIAAHDPTTPTPPGPVTDHEARITSLETEMAALKTQFATLSSKRKGKE
jgi:hypothetical protein